MMILLMLAVAAHSPSTAAALRACRPVLARKAGGEIERITVESRTRFGSTTVIRGRLTVFVGMGPPPPGSASAHHLIRADYRYRCWVRHGRVRKTTLSQ